MLTQDFVLGIVIALGFALVAAGVMIVSRMLGRLNRLEKSHADAIKLIGDLFHDIHDLRQDLDFRLDRTMADVYSHCNELHEESLSNRQAISDEIVSQYREHQRQHHDMVRSVNDQITDAVTQCKSYTDSRIDRISVKLMPSDAVKPADNFNTKNYM